MQAAEDSLITYDNKEKSFSIIDSKTGNILSSTETDGYSFQNVDTSGQIIVSTLDEGFSGNTFSIGIMDNKLE